MIKKNESDSHIESVECGSDAGRKCYRGFEEAMTDLRLDLRPPVHKQMVVNIVSDEGAGQTGTISLILLCAVVKMAMSRSSRRG